MNTLFFFWEDDHEAWESYGRTNVLSTGFNIHWNLSCFFSFGRRHFQWCLRLTPHSVLKDPSPHPTSNTDKGAMCSVMDQTEIRHVQDKWNRNRNISISLTPLGFLKVHMCSHLLPFCSRVMLSFFFSTGATFWPCLLLVVLCSTSWLFPCAMLSFTGLHPWTLWNILET